MTRSITIGRELGGEFEPYEGTYVIRILNVSQASEALRSLANGKDKVSYINALMKASIDGPVKITDQTLQEMPYKVYRQLMDNVLELNETSVEEANFLPSSPSASRR
jgi:hypothetical protein